MELPFIYWKAFKPIKSKYYNNYNLFNYVFYRVSPILYRLIIYIYAYILLINIQKPNQILDNTSSKI